MAFFAFAGEESVPITAFLANVGASPAEDAVGFCAAKGEGEEQQEGQDKFHLYPEC
jgi:hypothetical protein